MTTRARSTGFPLPTPVIQALAWPKRTAAGTRKILESTIESYIGSNSLTRGAAIAFYSVTSLIPVLVIIIAIAGFAVGKGAARVEMARNLAASVGADSANLIQGAIDIPYNSGSNGLALIVGSVIFVLSVSGVFGELQSALNAIWNVEGQSFSIIRLMRGRAVSTGLVVGLAFLLLVSQVIDATIGATSGYINDHFRYAPAFLNVLGIAVSYLLAATLFAAIYKVLPDKGLQWSDVIFGALVTAIAFECGKKLIAFYLVDNTVVSRYGAAGALASLLFWIYYSAQIFLLGACFTKACAVAEHRRLGHAAAHEGGRSRECI